MSINTSYIQRRVQQECDLGKYIRRINQDGTVVCMEDTNSGGDIFSIGVTNGLLGGGTSGDVLLSINFSMVQSRILEHARKDLPYAKLTAMETLSVRWMTTLSQREILWQLCLLEKDWLKLEKMRLMYDLL